MGRQTRTGSGSTSDLFSRGARQGWSLEVRQRVVRAVVEQGLPVQRVARAVGVPGTTASECVRKYRRGGLPALEMQPTGPPLSTGTQMSSPVGTENSPPPGSLRGLGGADETGLELVLEPVGIAPDVEGDGGVDPVSLLTRQG